jgi:hypothetical protein
MNEEQKQELERLRKLANESLLSMSQVDWLLQLIDQLEADVERGWLRIKQLQG